MLGTDRGVGWPPSQEPRHWEPPRLQTPGGDVLPPLRSLVLLPAWVAEMLRGSESPPCTPPGPWRSPQQVLELPLDSMWPCSTAWAGREGGLEGLVASRWSTGRLEAAACCGCPPALPSCCSLSCTPNLGRPPSQRHSLSPRLTLSLGVKGVRAPSAAFSPLLQEPGAGSMATRGPSGHVSGLGSARGHPWGRQLGSQALALSP